MIKSQLKKNEDKKSQNDKKNKNVKIEMSFGHERNKKKNEVKTRNEELKKESSLTPRSRFKFIRQKFENSGGGKVVNILNYDAQLRRKEEKVEQQTPSVVNFRKSAEKAAVSRPFSEHILSNIDAESNGVKERPNGKRKFSDQISIFEETASFSPNKRPKIKNCPNFNSIYDRLGSYPVGRNLEKRDAKCGQKGDPKTE